MSRLGALLVQIRKKRKQTQAECAITVGVCKLTWYRWEIGVTVPQTKNLSRLSKWSNLSPQKLLELMAEDGPSEASA